jgi:DNA polymerase (family 10)
MTNAEIAKVFLDIAELLKLKKDNIFKIRAYQKAARSIEELAVPVAQLVAGDRLREIPGVGEAITKKITELVTTGRLAYYERLKAEFPDRVDSSKVNK